MNKVVLSVFVGSAFVLSSCGGPNGAWAQYQEYQIKLPHSADKAEK